MSYILDALKKAAEQRDAQAPAMRRLLSPATEFPESPRWRMALVGGTAAIAGAIVAVWVLWPARAVVSEKPPPMVAERPALPPPTTARIQPEAAPAEPEGSAAQPTPPASAAMRSAPKPVPPVKAAPEKRPAPVTAPTVQARPVPIESGAPQAIQTPPGGAESAPARPQPTPPPVTAAVRPAPLPAAVAPPPPASTRGDTDGKMRLEVIVYSDERARRLAFINGRKYVEGDTLLDGSRIQEIQPNAVVIVDEGRRVVLKP
ncbi:MAG TPA: general secretion pathway protein GspB [Methylomirabilota bacterium]